MGKLDPVGEGGKESGSIIGGWGGQLLWKAYVPGILYGVKVEFDLARTLNSWVDNKKEKLVYVYKNEICMSCLLVSCFILS